MALMPYTIERDAGLQKGFLCLSTSSTWRESVYFVDCRDRSALNSKRDIFRALSFHPGFMDLKFTDFATNILVLEDFQTNLHEVVSENLGKYLSEKDGVWSFTRPLKIIMKKLISAYTCLDDLRVSYASGDDLKEVVFTSWDIDRKFPKCLGGRLQGANYDALFNVRKLKGLFRNLLNLGENNIDLWGPDERHFLDTMDNEFWLWKNVFNHPVLWRKEAASKFVSLASRKLNTKESRELFSNSSLDYQNWDEIVETDSDIYFFLRGSTCYNTYDNKNILSLLDLQKNTYIHYNDRAKNVQFHEMTIEQLEIRFQALFPTFLITAYSHMVTMHDFEFIE